MPEVSSPRQKIGQITSKLDEIDERCRHMHKLANESLIHHQQVSQSRQNSKRDEIAKLKSNINQYKEQIKQSTRSSFDEGSLNAIVN